MTPLFFVFFYMFFQVRKKIFSYLNTHCFNTKQFWKKTHQGETLTNQKCPEVFPKIIFKKKIHLLTQTEATKIFWPKLESSRLVGIKFLDFSTEI